jgi:hypothetical protein
LLVVLIDLQYGIIVSSMFWKFETKLKKFIVLFLDFYICSFLHLPFVKELQKCINIQIVIHLSMKEGSLFIKVL